MTNIWAIEKDQRIRHVLVMLATHLGESHFIVEGDAVAADSGIYLRHRLDPEYRAYLYTTGQDDDRYGVHLEFPDTMTTIAPMETYENITLRSLVDILSVHFEIPVIADRSLL